MYYQNTEPAPIDFQKYACLFSACLFSREALLGMPWELDEAVKAWERARGLGIISGDLNLDGDYDDAGEDEIQNYERLFQELNLPLKMINQKSLGLVMDSRGWILPASHGLDPRSYWVVEEWKWRQRHFVKNDGTGMRPVDYDPIRGGSLTVRNGECVALRVFEIREV